MGMIGNFLLVTDSELDALARSPATVFDVIDGAYDDRAADFVDVDGRWRDADPSSSESFVYSSQAFMALKALIQRGRTTERGLLVWLS